ncbi:hypothetical protein FRB96_008450, partial [Tulasnella sp. 330]
SHASKRQLRTRQADKHISFLERVGETFGCKLTGHFVILKTGLKAVVVFEWTSYGLNRKTELFSREYHKS